jgi:hypothetical protein
VVFAAPGNALLGPVEPPGYVRKDDRVYCHCPCEDLPVPTIADPGEGVERAGAATEAFSLVLVWVLGAVFVLIAAVVFLGAAGLLYLLQGVAVSRRVC